MEKNVTEMMAVRMPVELKDALKKRAEEMGKIIGVPVSLSDIVILELKKATKQPLPVVRVPGASL